MYTIPTTVFGLLTLIIVSMATVIAKQYGDNKTLQAKFDSLQDSRLQDAKDNLDKFGQPLATISQTMNLIYSKLEDSKKG